MGVLLSDAHVDLPYLLREKRFTGPWRGLKEGDLTLEEAGRAGLVFFISAIYLEDRYNGPLSLLHFRDTLRYLDSIKEDTFLVRDAASIEPEEGKIKTLFSIENADFLCDEMGLVEKLREKGIFVLGLTHCGPNRLAEGNLVLYGDGIKRDGRSVLKGMEGEGLILDLAHLNERSFYQALDLFRGPLMASHTGIREIYDIPRNITLAQAREVMERGGVVGISINPELLWEGGCIPMERLYASIDILVQAFGPERVCLGSDVCGFQGQGFSYSDTVSSLKETLLDKGYGPATYEILGGNLIRFLKESLPKA